MGPEGFPEPFWTCKRPKALPESPLPLSLLRQRMFSRLRFGALRVLFGRVFVRLRAQKGAFEPSTYSFYVPD
jgi:hypothetical protein